MQYFVSLLFLLGYLTAASGQVVVQNGKVNFTVADPSFSYCTTVQYPRAFSNSRNVRVLASISHGEVSSTVHDSAVVWTSDVTQSSFRICLLESGLGTNGSSIVNWIAFRGTPSGMLDGAASFNTFTSGTKCERVNFAQRFSSVPNVLATARHAFSNRPQDAMNIWIEELKEDYFRVCLREVKAFDGKHQNLEVDWLAFTRGGVNLTFASKLQLKNVGAPLEKDNFAFCKVHNFSEDFYAPPVVIVTTNHLYDGKNVYSIKPENNVLNSWIEEITTSYFRVCVKDVAGMESRHDPVTVDYAVVGDLDPCINISCNYFAVCKAFGPRDARCICVDNCPSYEEPVCSSNGTTYDNKCMFQREMCHLKANFTLYHPGACTGFPSQKGRHLLHRTPSWVESVCEQVPLAPYVFYPDKPVHIQVSVNHVNHTEPSYVHEAVVVWVEDIREDNFTVCVTQAGRNEKKDGQTFATVDWLAYQGAPDGGVSGKMDMPTWWTGTNCRSVSLPPKKFKTVPTVLVSAEHERHGVKHDASSVWVEDATTTSFKICIRELQNFDGAHQRIHADWMAFEELHRPLFREHGSVYFANGKKPSKEFNYAFCEDVVFKKHYNNSPAVLVSASHSTKGGNLNPIYNSISVWAEYINRTGFRACMKELFVNQHDPLSVSYAVMPDVCEPGWSFYNGSCYSTSETCENWSNAGTICRNMGANLPAIETQEENVYIQHRHNGDKAWIGLNDIATEGLFVWVDGCPEKFRYWAEKQPNNIGGEDCVHTLGVDHGYKWNDVDCAVCHQYTCKKDYDECTSSPCLNGGTCVNGKRNFKCICPQTHKGETCQEIDKCSSSPCLNGGTCTDGVNNYTCSCPSPFFGNQCQETDECKSNPCLNGGKCVDGLYNFTCVCPSAFDGNRCEALGCNFDTSMCGFGQDSNDKFNWTRRQGGTSSSSTGPSADHTTGNGYYMYIETSSPRQQGDNAKLNSPKLPFSGSMCLKFYYHMYGANIGKLEVMISGNKVFTASGDKGNKWLRAAIDVSLSGKHAVTFEGTRGSSYRGDIAIDDFSLEPGSCSSSISRTSCKNLLAAGKTSSGSYSLKVSGKSFQVYCDMSSNGGGWTLISRFSNADSANWMQSSGSWWYDRTSSYGSGTSPSNNYDMISPAFWLVTGHYIKITRSDDSSNTALLYTSSCTGGKTFRSFITSYGNFRSGAVWNSNACRGSCYISGYGGSYSSTVGFSQMHCSSNLQSSRRLSFWCDWSNGDGAVMMIGGGGNSCNRADHGVGITEANEAKFGSGNGDGDFGDNVNCPTSYSLNLWIK